MHLGDVRAEVTAGGVEEMYLAAQRRVFDGRTPPDVGQRQGSNAGQISSRHVDAVLRDEDARIEGEIRRGEVERSPDAVAGHDVAAQERRPPEEPGGSLDIACLEETPDARATRGNSVDLERRDDCQSHAFRRGERRERSDIARARDSESE